MQMRPGVGIKAVEVGVARRWRRWMLGLCAVVLVSLSAASAAHAADRIYWSNFGNDTIAWTNLDGRAAAAPSTPATPRSTGRWA